MDLNRVIWVAFIALCCVGLALLIWHKQFYLSIIGMGVIIASAMPEFKRLK